MLLLNFRSLKNIPKENLSHLWMQLQQVGKSLYRFIYGDEPVSSHPIEMKRDAQPKLSLDLFADVEDGKIVYNAPKKVFKIDIKKHLLEYLMLLQMF